MSSSRDSVPLDGQGRQRELAYLFFIRVSFATSSLLAAACPDRQKGVWGLPPLCSSEAPLPTEL